MKALHQFVSLEYRNSVKMQKRRRTSSSCIALFLCSILLSLILPRCVSCAGTDKTDKTVVNKEEYYSATINATVQDSRGLTKRVISKEDGRYGQNSPKSEVKGIIITPAAVNGGECVCVPVSDCIPVHVSGLVSGSRVYASHVSGGCVSGSISVCCFSDCVSASQVSVSHASGCVSGHVSASLLSDRHVSTSHASEHVSGHVCGRVPVCIVSLLTSANSLFLWSYLC